LKKGGLWGAGPLLEIIFHKRLRKSFQNCSLIKDFPHSIIYIYRMESSKSETSCIQSSNTTLIYIVAGLSSRFGGAIKAFTLLNGKTLIERSLEQAMVTQPSNIVFVVSQLTYPQFSQFFGNLYKNIPVQYAFQEYDTQTRDRPWGTADAVCCAIDYIADNCIICNGDDLYGPCAFTLLNQHKSENVSIGYILDQTIDDEEPVNRGILSVNNGLVNHITEFFKISRQNMQQLNANDFCSMNLFLLQSQTVKQLSHLVQEFKKTHPSDRKIECILSNELSLLISQGLQLNMYPTHEQWIGITYPHDIEKAEKNLK